MRTVRAKGLSLWCARAARGGAAGGVRLRRRGAPLLPTPTELTLQIERNCSDTHNGRPDHFIAYELNLRLYQENESPEY